MAYDGKIMRLALQEFEKDRARREAEEESRRERIFRRQPRLREIEGELRREYQARGLYITGRYSPGYGDCPLALQSVFAAYLDTGRKIGLTVGSSGLLFPRKSVTAILGISQKPVTGYRAGCAHCVLQKTCQYRKRGVSCEQE